MKRKIILVILLFMFSGGASAHDNFWWGLGLGALLFSSPVYVAPPAVYYQPPPQPRYYYPLSPQYYSPSRYCYRMDVGGGYDYYGRYIPNIQLQCE